MIQSRIHRKVSNGGPISEKIAYANSIAALKMDIWTDIGQGGYWWFWKSYFRGTQVLKGELFLFFNAKKILKQSRWYFFLKILVLELITGSRDYHEYHSNDEDEGNGIAKMKKRNDVILPDSSMQKLKTRMLIIRMKLMHVIRSFHFYLMTRVSVAIV